MAEQNNGHEPYMTVREMVSEIRHDVKELREVAAMLRPLIPTAEDHESRLRGLEHFQSRVKYGFPPGLFIAIAGLVAALAR